MGVPETRVRNAHPAVAKTVQSLMLQERTKWAMRIHDGLTQSVTSAVLELQTIRHRIELDPEEAAAAIADVEAAIRADLQEIREILFELHEGERISEPPLAVFVNEVVERWKLPARVSVEGDLDLIPASVRDVAHGILAEALANAAKHSGSADITVRLRAGIDELRIEVEDRGRGIAVVNGQVDHFGLRLMRERVEMIQGSLEIESTPGRGTRIVACLPVGEVSQR